MPNRFDPRLALAILALATVAAFGLVGLSADAALAQDSTAPAADAPATGTTAPAAQPGGDFSTGEPVAPLAPDGEPVGTEYVKEKSGDWELRCVRTLEGFDPCQMYQLLLDSSGNAVAEVSFIDLPSGEAAVGATVVTPLQTLLTQQVTLAIDASKPKRYPFTWCDPVGCYSRIGFTKEELTALKRGAKAAITIVPMLAPDQRVVATASLAGFTAGYDRMVELNTETAKAAQHAAEKAKADGGN